VSGVRQAALWLRSLHRVLKLALLMIAVWTLVLGAAHPFAVLFIAGPAAALFLICTTAPG